VAGAALYGFAYAPQALENLAALQPKIRRQIAKRVQGLAAEPYPQGCKKVQNISSEEEEPVYRVRQGDYRILYVVRNNPDQIIVLDVGHRKDIYK